MRGVCDRGQQALSDWRPQLRLQYRGESAVINPFVLKEEAAAQDAEPAPVAVHGRLEHLRDGGRVPQEQQGGGFCGGTLNS